jgi:hypothetical protein
MRDVRRVLMAAMARVPAVRLVVITAPGADVLPWDLDRCELELAHRHGGAVGCKVQAGPRDAWEAAVADNWRQLREAVSQRLRRRGLPSPFLAWVDEDQGREVWHRNLVLEEGPAARTAHAALVALAPRYGFGFVDRKVQRRGTMQALNYLVPYLAGGASGSKARKDLSAAARRAVGYRRVWCVAPRWTKTTGCTRRSLRLGRQVWAARQGLCPMPTTGRAVVDWGVVECETGEMVCRVFLSDTREPPGA